MFPGDSPGDGQTLAVMKKIFRYLGILVCLSLDAAARGDTADNGVECSVVMEKHRFDASEAFPDFKLVFTNKGEKTVRLFDDFYPLKDNGPHISIEIFWKLTKEKKEKVAAYYPHYCIERGQFLNFITLKPGERHEVLIKDAYLLMHYFGPSRRLRNGEKYELEVIFRDGYGDSGVRRKYVGRKDFSVVDQSPWR